MKLDALLAKTLDPMIYHVWNCIGGDLPEDTDNETAIECCIDADRPEMFAKAEHPEEFALFREAIDEHGYHKVLQLLKKHITLC